jgi:glycosyltransferase involved in cell wall biosynthesis
MTRRVVLVCGEYPPVLGGISDYTRLLAGALARAGAAVTVVTTRVSGMEPDRMEEGVRILREMPSWRMRDLPRLLRRLDEAGTGAAVHIQYPGVAFQRNPMINLLPAIARARRPRTPVVLTVHDARVMRRRWRARLAPMLAAAAAVVHVDAPDRAYLDAWSWLRRPLSVCIPIGANIFPVRAAPELRAEWRAALGLPGPDPIAAFFGMLYPHKGLTELVDAVRRLRAGGRAVRLLVIGDFDRPTPFEAEVAALLAEGLRQGWAAWLRGGSPDEVSRALHASDLAALPLHSGAASNRSSLLTTLAHQLPTVTTDGPATPAEFGRHFPVSLVPPRDAPALAEAMGAVLDRSPAADFAARCAAAIPSWEAIAARHLELYDRLAPGARAAA